MGPRERHWRLARKMEFDVCEENVGAYFMARDRGDPVTALPVFLHRRFRHGFVFVNTNAGIKTPKDLIGKRVGGTNFQPAGNIWMRGILEEHYGVPHREITWIVDRSEDVPFTAPPGLRIEMKTVAQVAERHAGGRRHAGDDLAHHPAPVRAGRQADRRACSRTTSRSRWTISARPAFSRSCTSPPSSRRSSTNIRGWPPTWSRRSRRRSSWPTAGSPIRAWCRSPGCAPRSRSRRRSWAAIPGTYGLTPANRKKLETIQRYTHQQGMIGKLRPLDELFEDTDLGDSGGSEEV